MYCTRARARAGEGVTLEKSPPPSPARAYDSPPAWTSPQRLKATHVRFPCQRQAPPLFKLSLILQQLIYKCTKVSLKL